MSDHAALLGAARTAGVQRAKELLSKSDGLGAREVTEKYQQYLRMGINAVPVIVLDDKYVISNGAPERDFLRGAFKELIDTGAVPHLARVP